jgi:hypothetical protein
MSADRIFEKLQQRFSLDFTPRRLQIRQLILERIRLQPAPQTIVVSRQPLTTSTASTTVFNVPELLESILSCLSVEDLLVSCRVNSAFHRIIATSPPLQKKLFLLPESIQPQCWRSFKNVLSGRVHAVVAPSTDNVTIIPPPYIATKPVMVASINPLLQPFGATGSPIAKRLLFRNEFDYGFINRHMLKLQALPHMYLTNPPPTCVHFVVEYREKRRIDGATVSVRRSVCNPAGVTFGAIYKKIHERGAVGVVIYERRKDNAIGGLKRVENSLLPDTTVREQIALLEQRGFGVSIGEGRVDIWFCHLATPSDEEFEEMRRNGRVEGEPEVGNDSSEAVED